MPQHKVTVECPVSSSFEVDAVRGMFDLKPEKASRAEFCVEIPADDEAIDDWPGEGAGPWRIGVIVGPSGSGKTTVAREAYGKRFCEGGFRWDKGQAVCSQIGGDDLKQSVLALSSVGFSSPPAWLRPHHVLSGGERFRSDLARALVSRQPLVAFDEFTSVVDRNVAKIGSAAVAKAIRKGSFDRDGQPKQFVAVTCHYDVLDWLEPDWVLDMSKQQLARGRLHRRPEIRLTLAPVHRSAWVLFRRHHYLNTEISPTARCFAAFWGDEPVAFSAWMHAMTRKRRKGDMREHRTVVLPDYQGVGIGNRVSDAAASVWRSMGRRAYSTTSHPSMIHYRSRSPSWRRKRLGRAAKPSAKALIQVVSSGRVTAGFEYVGERPIGAALAEAMATFYPREHMLRTLRRIGRTTAQRLAAESHYSVGAVGHELAALVAEGRVVRSRYRSTRWAYEAAG